MLEVVLMGEEEFGGQIRRKRAFHTEDSPCEGEEEARPTALELWECSLYLGGLLRAFKPDKS